MGRRARTSGHGRRGGCGCSLVFLLLLLAVLVVAAEFGARWFLADRAEREISTQIDAPVTISFGGDSLLWDLATTRSASTVHLTSPGSATVPGLDLTGQAVSLSGSTVHVGTVHGTAVLNEQQMVAAAAQGAEASSAPIAGLTEIRSVRPDAAAGLLRADLGGLAEIGVTPGVMDGQLTLRPEQTALLGFPLPDGLFSGITAKVSSTVASLPQGMVIEGARVVNEGLEVTLGGSDVTVSQN